MTSSNITILELEMDRVRLRRATFELLEFSPVPPSSYLRMSPECTPRTSPSMFLRWTTPRRSTEMKRMTSRPRPGCSSVTRWSLGPPAASSWHRGQRNPSLLPKKGVRWRTAVIGRIPSVFPPASSLEPSIGATHTLPPALHHLLRVPQQQQQQPQPQLPAEVRGPAFPADELQREQPDEDAEDLGAGGGGQQHHEALRHETQRLHGRARSVVLSLLCPSRRSSSNKNETSLEADEPEHNHEGKLKTYREKKLVSADQPSLRRTPGAKDRERFHTGCLFVRNHFI